MRSIVRDALKELATSTTPALIGHREKGLTRTSGSFVTGVKDWDDTYNLLASLVWEEVPHEEMDHRKVVSACRYFQATTPPNIRAFKNVLSVEEARVLGMQVTARIHKPGDPNDERDPNPTGWGLFAKGVAAINTQKIQMGIGPVGDLMVPWFWYPGDEVVSPLRKEHYPQVEKLAAGELNKDDWMAISHLTVHLE